MITHDQLSSFPASYRENSTMSLLNPVTMITM